MAGFETGSVFGVRRRRVYCRKSLLVNGGNLIGFSSRDRLDGEECRVRPRSGARGDVGYGDCF